LEIGFGVWVMGCVVCVVWWW